MKRAFCRPIHRVRQRAFTIVEALVYIGVSVLLLGIGTAAMYRCIDSSMTLRRSADDISRALHIGERWRADVRAALGPVKLEDLSGERVLSLPGAQRDITYRFGERSVSRRVNSGPWVQVMTNIHSSVIEPDRRSKLIAWRWELELQTKAKAGRVRPLFTFLAVSARPQTQ